MLDPCMHTQIVKNNDFGPYSITIFCVNRLNTMSSQRIHDPLFHFETHFPESLSRTTEFGPAPPTRRGKRSRANRNAARYKTQPVTFDEITEVDEDSMASEESSKEHHVQQLQAFSRSMDGLVPKVSTQLVQKQPTISPVVDKENRLHGEITNNRSINSIKEEKNECSNSDEKRDLPSSMGALSIAGIHGTGDNRRQKMTAKAKRRQMEAEKDKEKDSTAKET